MRTVLMGLSVLVLYAVAHSFDLRLPPGGYHLWRQTQTLAVARNLAEEQFDVLHPRVDDRGAGDGVTGMEFPFVNAVIGAAYRVFGFSHSIHRAALLVVALGGIAGAFALASTLARSPAFGQAAAFLLIASPLFAYYSITALPDVPGLALVLLGGALVCARGRAWLAIGSALFWLGCAVKLSLVVYAPVLLYLAMRDARLRPHRMLLGVAHVVCAAAVIAWYVYAKQLQQASGIMDFTLHAAWPYSVAAGMAASNRALLTWTPEMLCGYGGLVCVAVGVVVILRDGRRQELIALSLCILGLAAYAASQLPMFRLHDYYLVPMLPVTVWIGARGVMSVLARRAAVRVAVLLLVLGAGHVRTERRFHRVESDAYLLELEPLLDRVDPSRSLVIADGDASPSIYLYFMHRKGWTVHGDVSPDQLDSMREAGARFLVASSRTRAGAAHVVARTAHFTVFRL